jgi:hypothetical protein
MASTPEFREKAPVAVESHAVSGRKPLRANRWLAGDGPTELGYRGQSPAVSNQASFLMTLAGLQLPRGLRCSMC